MTYDINTIKKNLSFLLEEDDNIIDYFLNKSVKIIKEKIEEKKEDIEEDIGELLEEYTIYLINVHHINNNPIKTEKVDVLSTTYKDTVQMSPRLKELLKKYNILEDSNQYCTIEGW